jgi:ribosomal protein S6
MPVYELFCLARPQITKESLAAVIRTASNAVFSNSGVMTDIQSYGNRDLAYPIRKAGSKYTEVCRDVARSMSTRLQHDTVGRPWRHDLTCV